MTTEAKTEKKIDEEKSSPWLPAERESTKEKYGCELLVENGSYKDVSTRKSPTDAYIIKYHHDDKVCFDLTRGTKINFIPSKKVFSDSSELDNKIVDQVLV